METTFWTRNTDRMMLSTIGLAVVLMAAGCFGRTYEECELARELVYEHGFSRRLINDWICLIKSESSMNTKATNVNTDGSTDYGLFQINDRYWCAHGKPGGGCNVRCEDLMKNDISTAAECALHIYNVYNKYDKKTLRSMNLPILGKPMQGFTAWNGWKAKCMNRHIPSMDECFECESSSD